MKGTLHSWIPRPRTLLLAAGALAIVLALASTFVVSTGRLHTWLRSAALEQVNQVINGRVEIDSLSGSLLGGLTIHGLRVSTAGQPVLTADTVELGYSLWPLLRRNYVFSQLRVTRPHVWLAEHDGVWNVTSLMKPADRPNNNANWHVTFERVAIVDGTVVVRMSARDPITVERLVLDGRVALGSDGSRVDVRSSRFHEASTATDADLAGSVAVETSGLTFKDFRLTTPGLGLAGGTRFMDGRFTDVQLAASLTDWQPARLQPYVPAELARMGSLNGTVDARGSGKALETTWRLSSPVVRETTGHVTIDLETPETVGVAGDLRVAGLNPAPLADRADLSGAIEADATVDARLDLAHVNRSSGTVHVRSSGAAVSGFRIDRLDARVVGGGSRLRVQGRVDAYRAAISTAAVVALSDRGVSNVSATGLVQRVDIRNLPARLKAPSIATNVSAEYRVAWARERWSANLTTGEATVNGVRVEPTSTIAAVGNGSAVTITTHGAVSDLPASLLRIPDNFASSLHGTVDGEVTIPDLARATDLSQPTGAFTLSFIESDPLSLNPAQGLASLTFKDGMADVTNFQLKSPLANVSATGRLAIAGGEAAESDLEFTADATDLARLEAIGAPAAKGAARVTGRITGPAGAWRVKGTFGAQEFAYGDRLHALTLNGAIDVEMPSDPRETAGTVSLDGSFVVLAGNEIPKATIVARREARRLDLRGRLEQPKRAIDFDTGIDLYPDYQEVHLREMTIAGAGSPWRLAGQGDAVIRYGRDDLSIEHLVLTRDAERIEVAGQLPFTSEVPPASPGLAVTVSAVNAGDLSMLALGESRVTGTANGQVHVRSFGSATSASADVALVEGRVADVPFTEIRVQTELAKNAAEVTARVVEPAGAVLDITGRVPVGADAGDADLHVTGTGISLGLAQAVTTAVNDVQGQANLDLRVSGPLSALSVDGTLRLDAGAFTVAASGVRYKNINAGVRFDNDWAYVDTASLTDQSGGLLTLTGRTGLRAIQGGRQVDLALQSNRIRVLRNELGDVDVRADLRITGRLTAPEIKGSVVLSRARLEIDEIIKQFDGPPPLPAAVPEPTVAAKDSAAEASKPPAAEAESAAPPIPPASTGWPGATVDVAVTLPDNVVIRARDLRTGAGSMGLGDLNLTVGGNVTLRKAPDETPVVVGAVEVIRGFYDFQGRRFDVTRGSALDFRGGEVSNPAINVTGERVLSGVTARVQVTGTARRPVLALSSQPSLSESDVLALIVFNQPLSQLGTGEQVDLLDRASDIALGAVASTLTDSIGRSLDVDLFEIRAPSTERPGELALGTQVGQRVFVGFRQEFGSSDATRLSIEYQLTQALRMVTSVGQGSRDNGSQADAARLDLVYTLKY